MQNLFNNFNIKSEYAKGAITASTLFMLTFLSAAAFALTLLVTAKFIINHNFAVEKYSGTIDYIDDINDQAPYVTDTEGENHMFYDKQGAHTFYLFSRYEPRKGTYLQVFEVKLYNSKTQRLRLLRLIW